MKKDELLKHNEIVTKTTDFQNKQLQIMKKDLPRFIRRRKKSFAEEFNNYIEENCVDGNLMPDGVKIPMFEVIQHTFSPLIKVAGSSPTYSADELALAFEFYKHCAEKLNKTGAYAPKIEDFCSLINISRRTFEDYQTSSSDTRTRDICDKIQDYCVARIADGAFCGVYDKVYSMFHQKSSNKQRDNDPVVNNTYVQNNTIMSDEQFNDLYTKYTSNN